MVCLMRGWIVVSCLDFKCEFSIDDNPLALNINDYLDVAIRDNKKRRFLFVSKTLGKHLPVNPKKCDELGELLVRAYKKKFGVNKNEKQMVIGFAETATALAHSFYSFFKDADYFIHTTREEVLDSEKIGFVEEHSHASEHNLYIANLVNIEEIDTIFLVDDEVTTAKTCINIINKLHERYKPKRYIITSLLNWIDKEREESITFIAKELNCEIQYCYLFKGNFNFNFNEEQVIQESFEVFNKDSSDIEVNYINLNFENYLYSKKYIKYTGRFGINRIEQKELENIILRESKKLKPNYCSDKILALGIEEFIYIPMMLSKYIDGDVCYHSITRSPIIVMDSEEYPIKCKYKIESFYNDKTNYIYNLKNNGYKESFLFMELDKPKEKINFFINILRGVGIKKVNIVRC